MSWCAICTSERGPFERRPLGKGNALVLVCRECDEEPAKVRLGPERGYEEREAMSNAEIQARLHEYLLEQDPMQADPEARKKILMMRERTPGWILMRARRRDGMLNHKDVKMAVKAWEHHPWFPELRYLGYDNTFFLFERPDPAVAAEQRRTSHNPLASLAILSRG